MKNSYDQLNIEYVETKKVSLFTKLISYILSLTIISIPLVEIIPGLEYMHNIYDYCIYGCLVSFGPNCFPFF
ncbi:hypothetical protein [Tenacibaculum aiptasiae]|uniref:hypothetical protein n=1 Tax=Tenacibaculum aiptasiae TaxID=426481 RepID=UPI003B5CA2B0